ncbi:MAG: hypothetical protein R3C03_11575 [Pirellulaceae bacterium]
MQFLTSAGIKVGTFPIAHRLCADEAAYKAQFADMDTICELAKSLEGSTCFAVIEAGSNSVAFQENFDRHQARIREVDEKLAEAGIELGLTLTPVSLLH